MAVPVMSSSKDAGSFPRSVNRKASLDDVLKKRRNRQKDWSHKWTLKDVFVTGSTIFLHLIALYAPFVFSWSAFALFLGLHFLFGCFGITLSYHRNLSHGSFKLPKGLEYFFAYLGVLACQMDPMSWVSNHRYHHQHADTERDPHSPTEGVWFSHIGWTFDHDYMVEKCGDCANVEDLKSQWFYRFIRKTYPLHPFGFVIVLYVLGGLPFAVWGGAVRIIFSLHITYLGASFSHIWGSQVWKTGDLSKNNWLVGILGFGEGWHNNHHAFEYSARHGFEWWQIDMTWYAIKFLEAMGLATDVKLVSDEQKQRKAL